MPQILIFLPSGFLQSFSIPMHKEHGAVLLSLLLFGLIVYDSLYILVMQGGDSNGFSLWSVPARILLVFMVRLEDAYIKHRMDVEVWR